jgi:hypothetical protein
MNQPALVVEPFSQPLGEAGAVCLLRARNDGWELEVILTRDPAAPPVVGEEVDAELLAAAGQALAPTHRPSGPLAGTRSGLGRSENAVFRFARGPEPPAAIVVHHGGASARFTVRDPSRSGHGAA